MNAYAIERCSDSFLRSTVERDHYLHRWPDPRSLPFGYRLTWEGQRMHEDGRPHGLVVFKVLQHKRQRGLFGYEGLPTQWQVLDAARVWVHPDHQDYSWLGTNRKGELVSHSLCVFSRMLSMAIKRVQRDWLDFHGVPYPELPYHVRLIVSYCDREHHQGVGYRAAGFEHFGETSDGTKDIYVRRLKMPRWKWEPKQPRLLAVAA